jgi:hypothetical protein
VGALVVALGIAMYFLTRIIHRRKAALSSQQ